MEIASDILQLIGNTPIVRLKGFDTAGCEVLLKLENQNPGGSIKDRMALSMIEAAEKAGQIRPNAHLVEATAGNTGLSLALIARQKGYKLTLVVPDKMSREKISHLKALGAQVILTRSDVPKGHPEYYQELAAEYAKKHSAFYINQFGNEANPRGHETTTGPEIHRQTAGKLDALVCGVGSGGTITGLSRYFAKHLPDLEMVLADPEGSILEEYVRTGNIRKDAGSWLVEGIGEDFLPEVADLSRVKKAYSIGDQESFDTARKLLLTNGILGGSSTGTLLAAALRYCQEQQTPKTVMTFVCDSGAKYLSKMYDEHWMIEQGFLTRPLKGNIVDLVLRRHEEGSTISVGPEDTLKTVLGRMKMYDVSQLPVLCGEQLLGIIDETDLLYALTKADAQTSIKVGDILNPLVEVVSSDISLAELIPAMAKGYVAVLDKEMKFQGLITRIDLVSYLRKLPK